MKLAFIGGGKMAEAIIGGTLRQNLTMAADISVGEPIKHQRDVLAQRYGVVAMADNLKAMSGAEIVIVATKPQDLGTVLKTLRGKLQKHQVVASIVAGVSMKTLSIGLDHPAVIRVMLNTPAQIGAGMTLWTATRDVDEASRQALVSIFQTLGEQLYVEDEKYMDIATALSGSGPAYVFVFMESLIDAGVYLGMPRDMARKLVVQTVLGSSRLANERDDHLAVLKDMVTSPGGTTAEALLVLESEGFRASILNAVVAAYEQSKVLGDVV